MKNISLFGFLVPLGFIAVCALDSWPVALCYLCVCFLYGLEFIVNYKREEKVGVPEKEFNELKQKVDSAVSLMGIKSIGKS